MAGKKQRRILFIAPSLPKYDKNSGDLRLFSFLQALSDISLVTFLSQQEISEDERERYLMPLAGMNIDVHFSQKTRFPDLLRKTEFDLAIIEFYWLAEYYLPRLRMMAPACRIAVDSVDLHYARYLMKYEISGHQADLKYAEEVRHKELSIYMDADIAITITNEDDRLLKKDCPSLITAKIPNTHAPAFHEISRSRGRVLIFVGGFAHAPNIDAVRYFCRDILPLLRKSAPDVRLLVVGSDPSNEIKALQNEYIEVTGYVPSVLPYLQQSLISVAPLRFGAGMKGKVGEAMAHGVPVVTTSVGAQGMGLIHGVNAMIADTPENFSDSILKLMNDPDLYGRVQKNGLDLIARNFGPAKFRQSIKEFLDVSDAVLPKKFSLPQKTSFLFHYCLERFCGKISALRMRSG